MIFPSAAPVRIDDPGGLAVRVWAITVACGCALGAAGAVVVAATLVAVNGFSADVFTTVLYTCVFAGGIGAQVGLAAGIVVGLALALLVRCGQRALGPRVVARLVPAVALAITTLPFVIVVACIGAPAPAIGLLLLDAAFTAIGGLLVARSYLRRAPSLVH